MYGLPYYERGIRAMHGKIAPYNHLTFVKPKYKSKKDYIHKLSKEDIASIQEHYFLDQYHSLYQVKNTRGNGS